MGCCTATCAKWTTLTISLVLLAIGIFLIADWRNVFQNIQAKQLSVANENSKGFKMWKETPIPMYLEFHMFNWTNADRFEQYELKPHFEDIGPYVFYEHHVRENITFNDNDTVTYLTKRSWKFLPEKSVGSLDDEIVVLNPIVAVVANQIKDEHYLVKRAVNFFIEEKGEGIFVKKTVGEFLFDGYDDVLLDIAIKLNMSKLHLPFKRFGWFVDRNESATYDGVFNMYTGGKDLSKLGLIAEWNYEHQTSYYPGQCGIVNGSSGELWYPPMSQNQVSIFAPDMCSNVVLHRNGQDDVYGIQGDEYVGEADVFDNGTYFPSTACFASGQPWGVRGVSSCKFGAPAYMSFPHFYLADTVYTKNVDGMKPNSSLHATKVLLEPNTGLPLRVHAAFQLNLLMEQTKGLDILANVKTTMMPCFWFVQKAELSEELSSLGKILLIAPNLGVYTGYGFLVLGIVFLIIFLVILKRTWKSEDDEKLLSPQ